MSVTETKTDSGVIVVPELATRYRLAEAQLSVLPPVEEDDAEEWSGLRFQCEEVMMLIERLSRAEERERVLREALEWQPITPENLPKSGDEIYRAAGDRPNDVADVMAECGEYDAVELYHGYGFTHFRPINPPAAPEQPDRSVCPDCKSTTRSFRGRRGDEHGEWVCDNEWHAPEQGKDNI